MAFRSITTLAGRWSSVGRSTDKGNYAIIVTSTKEGGGGRYYVFLFQEHSALPPNMRARVTNVHVLLWGCYVIDPRRTPGHNCAHGIWISSITGLSQFKSRRDLITIPTMSTFHVLAVCNITEYCHGHWLRVSLQQLQELFLESVQATVK